MPLIAALVGLLFSLWKNRHRLTLYTLNHLKGPVKHPHHFVTAAGLVGFAHAFGHASMELTVGAFCYALAETLVTGAE